MADAVGPREIARRGDVQLGRGKIAVVVELRDAVAQEGVGGDLEILQIVR